MGREARIGLLLGASACLLAVMVDWVIEELNQPKREHRELAHRRPGCGVGRARATLRPRLGAGGDMTKDAVLLAGPLGLGHEMMARCCAGLLERSGWRTRCLDSMSLLGPWSGEPACLAALRRIGLDLGPWKEPDLDDAHVVPQPAVR
jgi:hypothetical protein